MMAPALATMLATNNLCEDWQSANAYLCNSVAANKSGNTTWNISGVGSGGQSGTGSDHSGGHSTCQGCRHGCED